MSQFVTSISTELTVPLARTNITGKMYTEDNKAHRIEVSVYEGRQFQTLTGIIRGIVVRNDGYTVRFNGSIDNEGRAVVELPSEAYDIIGPISVLVRHEVDDLRTVIAVCDGYISASSTDSYIVPEYALPSIDAMIDKLDQMIDAEERISAMEESASASATAASASASDAADSAAAAAESASSIVSYISSAANSASQAGTSASNAAASAMEAQAAANNIQLQASKQNGVTTAVFTNAAGNDTTIQVLDGETGNGIASAVLNQDYTLTLTFTDGTTYTTPSIRGAQGLKGDTGDAFHIVKTYGSISAMNADYSGTDVQIGEFVMIVSNVEDPDNAKVYVKGDQAYAFVVDMSGSAGIQGPKGDPFTYSDFTSAQLEALRGPQGVQGLTGPTGNGIASAVLNQDYTLTLTFTDGTTYTTPSIRGAQGIQGITGNGIASAVLNQDYTLTLTFTDGTTYTTPSIQGDTGDAATISSTSVTYQNSSSGTTVPSEEWLSSQPTTPQGQFLWVKTVLTWNNGQTTTLYSVSRHGIDGSGSVVSVQNVSPDANGNVDLSSVLAAKKNTQTAVSDPTASGNSLSFIDSISQDTQGVITATKKSVTMDASPTENSLNPVQSGGVKTSLDGKVDKAGDTMTGILVAPELRVNAAENTDASLSLRINSASKGTVQYNDQYQKLRLIEWKSSGADVYSLPSIAGEPTGNRYYDILTSKTFTPSSIGIVEDTDTATHTISKGQYVIWKGALYTAKSAIPSGTALSSSNLQSVSNGGLNELKSSVDGMYPQRFPFTKIQDLNDAITEVGLGYNTVPYFGRFQDATNAPTTGGGFLIGFAYTANNEVQLAMIAGTKKLYIRNKSNGTWAAWSGLG